MTNKVWSWRQAVQKADIQSTTKLVLLNLSIYMNELGGSCFPSTATQAKDTGLSERSICSHLEKAVDAGFIEKKKHGFAGQKWARNEYYATYPKGTELDVKALNEVHKGTEPNDKKALNEVQSNSPLINSPKKINIDPLDEYKRLVSKTTWRDFEKHRKNKKANITETAMIKIKNQAEKAGWSLEDALQECIMRGWTGFNADWVKSKKENKQGHDIIREALHGTGKKETVAEQLIREIETNNAYDGAVLCDPEDLRQDTRSITYLDDGND